jgi:DNA-binding NarL/FixJ family response regulator
MKILLVEDSEAIRVRLRALISELCCVTDVLEASGELDATRLACSESPDLIILDLKLAEGSGLGVLKSVIGCIPTSRVAVLTSHAETPYRKKCLDSGAQWFFDKAEGFGGVCRVVTDLCAGVDAGQQITTTEV